MKNLFVKELKPGISLFGEEFAVKSVKKSLTKQNQPYLDIEFTDKTGAVRGKVWPDALDKCDEIKEGEIAKVDGFIEEFNGPQVKVTHLTKVDDFDPANFVAVSEFKKDEMLDTVKKTISGTKNKHLKELLNNVFDQEFLAEFAESSAALRVHHSYNGGLMEHVVEMLHLSDAILDRYPKMNGDLLKAGILLHDIGKTVEYKSGITVSLTTRGKLLGHIFIGSDYVKRKAPKDMPESLLDEVIHLILSHHGELQFGSPVVPMTAEAIALSSLDRTSAFLNSSYKTIHDLDENEEFSAYVRNLGTELYRSPYLNSLTNEDIPF